MSAAADRLARLDPAILTDLRQRYADPRRHYHTWAHVEALLRWFDLRADTLDDPDAVFLAILFHDAVYDPRRTDNEAESAGLLTVTPLSGWSDQAVAKAVEMTLATARHQLPPGAEPEGDIAHFLDMDLSILGSERPTFRAYDRAIRKEYRHVFLPLYGLARRRILKGFLERPRLYFATWGREAFEAQARSNLGRIVGRRA